MRAFSALALIATLTVSATGQAASTLVYCSEGSPSGFNPALYTDGTTFDASSRAVYNRLVQFKPGSTDIQPALAESWEFSDDGLQVTFKLRKGVKFHASKTFKPSRDFNAEDVIWTFMRQKDPEHPFHKVSGGSYEYFEAMEMGSLIERIEKIDDHTIRFHLTRPEAPFIANLAMDFASIFSAEYAANMMDKGTPEKVDMEPIGTGPFMLVQYRKDSLIRYLANKSYFEGKPGVDRLVFSITPDASVRFAKLQKGECHIMSYPNPADLDRMDEDPAITLLSQEGLNVGYLAFNTKKKPFDDVRVRQALNMAVNREAIIDAVFLGGGKAAKNPLPPTIWSYNDDIAPIPFDLEKAKTLLTEAGYGEGFSTNIWAMPVQRPYNPNARRMAEIIQADWAKLGIEADIITYEWGEYLKRTKAGEHDTAMLGWTGDNGDPDNFLGVLLSCAGVGGSNRAQWCYQPFEKLLLEGRVTSDLETRIALYEEAQVHFNQQVPWAVIAHSIVFEPIRVEVKGYQIDPLGGHDFFGVSLD